MYPPPNRLYEIRRQYGLPSWSWLSSDCPLLLRENVPGSSSLQQERILFQIVEASADTPELKLKCLLHHGQLQLDTYGMFKVILFTENGTLEAFRLPDVYLDGILPDVTNAGDVTSALLLPARIYTEIGHTTPEKPVMLFECLLVKPCGEDGMHRRIGLLRVQDEPKAVDTLLAMRLEGFQVASGSHDSATSMYEIALV